MAATTRAISAEGRVRSMARLICGEKGSALFCDSGKTIMKEHGEEKKQTNADRIRSMSDDELADYIFGVSVHEKPCALCSDDCDFCKLSDKECKSKTLQWLQSEVEE